MKQGMRPYSRRSIASAIACAALWLAWPIAAKGAWFSTLALAREAAMSGDSGLVIMAAVYASVLGALPLAALYLALTVAAEAAHGLWVRLGLPVPGGRLAPALRRLAFGATLLGLQSAQSYCTLQPLEPASAIVALVGLLPLRRGRRGYARLAESAVAAPQVFLASQLLAFAPLLSPLGFGLSDVAMDVHTVAAYLGRHGLLDALGSALAATLYLSAALGSGLMDAESRSAAAEAERAAKEAELEAIRAKVMQNRLYLEINALAHDLKTPLVTIGGLNSLLLLSKDQGKLTEYCERIRSVVDAMTETIGSFLYAERRQGMSATELLDYVRAQLPIDEPETHISFVVAEGVPPLSINRVRVARALANLVDNALAAPRAGPGKRVHVQAGPSEGGLAITIRDDGQGIAPEDLERVWQIGHSTKASSGLGLPLAKQLVEENGGRIGLSSRPGEGTEVSIWLPSDTEDRIEG